MLIIKACVCVSQVKKCNQSARDTVWNGVLLETKKVMEGSGFGGVTRFFEFRGVSLTPRKGIFAFRGVTLRNGFFLVLWTNSTKGDF